MYKESNSADHKSFCERCKSYYYTCEGCPCWEYSDNDLERANDIQEEQIIQRHEDSIESSDYESDKAQSEWETWRTRNWE